MDKKLFNHGFILINKPKDYTSHDVVNKLRRKLNTKKIGHTGTLDPMATGVLVMCIGEATRLSEYIVCGTKTYIARVVFGTATNTLDIEGEILEDIPSDHINIENLKNILPKFIGNITQIPPMVSAIKKDGVPLYKLARKGIEVEREKREITINKIDILNTFYENNKFYADLEIECTHGTYIRTLCEDIGKELNISATLVELNRTKNSGFNLEDSISLEDFMNLEEDKLQSKFLPMSLITNVLCHIELEEKDKIYLIHGKAIPLDNYNIVTTKNNNYPTTYAATINNELCAIGVVEENYFKGKKVFINQINL